ncbi:uncharacterized protein LOC126672710 [Mercurialis annua]|uniref:uncharacterized protein LOC126672710 n=1 Tax=Mercurialis annua TaxID=3986 RepID=UPI0024AD59E0|nr:uncharacterized protein LOC126672710 [Mercurialis annua]
MFTFLYLLQPVKNKSPSSAVKKKASLQSPKSEVVIGDPSQMWSPRWNHTQYSSTRVDHCMKQKVVDNLKRNLSEEQLKLFKETSFGFVLDLPAFSLHGQVIHSLLSRQLNHPQRDELWIGVNNLRIRFSIEEFAVLTGLNCVGEIQKIVDVDKTNSLVEKYFVGVSKLNRQSVTECFLSKRWESDEDAVKIAFLYVLEIYFLSAVDVTLVERHHLDIIDSRDYNSYPWGKEVFAVTLRSFKSKHICQKQEYGYYRVVGFPIVLQYLFYECFPTSDGVISTKLGSYIPRCLNWSVGKSVNLSVLDTEFFSLGSKLEYTRIIPTIDERNSLMLDGFFGIQKKQAASDRRQSVNAVADDLIDTNAVNPSQSTGNQHNLNTVFEKVCNLEKQIMSMKSEQNHVKKQMEDYHVDLKKDISEVGAALNSFVIKMNQFFEKSADVAHESDKERRKDDNEVLPHRVDGKDNGDKEKQEVSDKSAFVDNQISMEDSDVVFTDSELARLDEQLVSIYSTREADALLSSQAASQPVVNVASFEDYPCPFMDNEYSLLDAYKDCEIFNWVEQGFNKKLRIFTGRYGVIDPPFKFAGELQAKKKWLHTLNFVGCELSTSHVDTVFHYLRKKSVLLNIRKPNFTTADSSFGQILEAEYRSFLAAGSKSIEINASNTILEYYVGQGCGYSKPWTEIDDLLIPIIVTDPNHWILARVNFEDCKVYVYNSMKSPTMDAIVHNYMQAYIHYLPKFLKNMDFYSTRTSSSSFALTSSLDSRYESFSYENVPYMPVQSDSDCGAFVCLFAEHFISSKRIPSTFSLMEMETYRNRLVQSLIKYGRWKQSVNLNVDVIT